MVLGKLPVPGRPTIWFKHILFIIYIHNTIIFLNKFKDGNGSRHCLFSSSP